MSRPFLFSLLLVYCTVRVFSQAVSLDALKLQREEFQNNIRTYQDSLADINFLIAEMESGKDTEISNSLAEKEYLRYSKSFNKKPTVNFSRRASSNVESEASMSATSVSKPGFHRAKVQLGGNTKQKAPPRKSRRRVGAICNDGTRSYATGRGACSHHGGVSYWLVE